MSKISGRRGERFFEARSRATRRGGFCPAHIPQGGIGLRVEVEEFPSYLKRNIRVVMSKAGCPHIKAGVINRCVGGRLVSAGGDRGPSVGRVCPTVGRGEGRVVVSVYRNQGRRWSHSWGGGSRRMHARGWGSMSAEVAEVAC